MEKRNNYFKILIYSRLNDFIRLEEFGINNLWNYLN